MIYLLQKLGHEIVAQLKEQKRKGKTGPLKLQKVARKPRKSVDGSDDDEDKKFTNITAQLAWERDIDLTKGQAFTQDPASIEISDSKHIKQAGLANNVGGNHSMGTKSDKKLTETDAPITPILNGNANANPSRTIKKFVKKPNGTPKTSPKVQKQFSVNRVTPLPLDSRDGDDLSQNFLDSGDNSSQTDSKSQQKKWPASLDTKRTVSSIHFDLDHFVVNADEKYVSNISHGTLDVSKNRTPAESTHRIVSADSKEMYDQWVDEIIEGSRESSPSKSETSGSPSHKHRHHKTKKPKKEKKERKDKEKRSGNGSGARSRSEELKERRSPRMKTPTSDELLLVESDTPIDESTL